jgi:toluene monooxygenase system ferredoxin subunit
MTAQAPDTFVRLCGIGDLEKGAMSSFEVGDHEIIVLWPADGEPKAYDGLCPHQQLPLADGDFDGRTLVCIAHRWSFDAATGETIWPPDGCKLVSFPLRIEGAEVMIEIAGSNAQQKVEG